MDRAKLLAMLPVLLVSIAAAPARAQEAPRFGLTASLAAPNSTFGPSGYGYDDFLSMGFSIGATCEWALNDSVALRAKAEYAAFGSKDSEYAETSRGLRLSGILA